MPMKHTHHHHAPHHFNRAFGVSVGLNLLYTIIQAFFAINAHSMSLLADAGHNLSDVLGLLLAWAGSWLLTRPATERYSYGYKRTSILAALINAIILVGASFIIAYESIIRFVNPESVATLTVMIVAFIGVIINMGTALLFFKERHHDLNMKGAFLHLMSDALLSLGVVLGALIMYYTHWHWIDSAMGLLIVSIILWSTWGLLMDSVNLIMDGVPRGIAQQAVRQFLLSQKGVKEIHDMHIWGLSSNEIALTAHVIMPDAPFSDDEYHRITHELKDHFKITHVTIQVERGEGELACHTDC